MGAGFNELKDRFDFSCEPLRALLRSRMFVMTCNALKEEVQKYAVSRLGQIESQAIEAIADRIENGDTMIMVGPNGETYEKKRPIRGKELAGIMAEIAKRKDSIQDRLDWIQEGGKEDAVRALAEKLHNYVKAKEINGEAQEVDG